MADPTGPGVVEGTENDDLIDATYTDGDGDSVTGGADLVYGRGGDDTIEAGSGNDTIYGDSGSGEVSEQKVIDFNDLAAGTIVSDQYDGVSIYSYYSGTPTMIFDTANPTGGDYDLATSNLGGVLILSEDGDSSDPDDAACGGKMVFDFDDPVHVDQLTFLDLDESYATVKFYDADGNLISSVKTYGSYDNSQIIQDYDVEGVSKMVVEMSGSGAIDNVTYTTTTIDDGSNDGNDVINAGDGDDLVYGEGGSDTIDGGTGNDTIYGGGGEETTTTERELFEWSEGPSFYDGNDTPDFTQNTGTANITFTTVSESYYAETEYETATQYTADLDTEVGENSSLLSLLHHKDDTATYSWDSDVPVENVEFRINDLDGDGRVTVRAYDENGNPIEVILSDAGTGLALSDTDGVAGFDTATSIDSNYTNNDNPEHSVLVTIEGPVSRWEIIHTQDGYDDTGITITDIAYDVTVVTPESDDGLGDSLIGGLGDDVIYGQGGNDTISGDAGADTLDGGTGNDIITAGIGNDSILGGDGDDVIDAGADDDVVWGGDGNDVIFGGDDDDLIWGGAGDDSITGGEDRDTMSGGDGNDTFYVSNSAYGDGDEITGGNGPDDTTDWDVLDLTGAGPYTINATADATDTDAFTGTVTFENGEVLHFSQIEEIICFTPGTAILTPSGEVAVEDLKVGDKVVTRDNGLQTIRWVGKKHLSGRDLFARPKLRPILIRAGSLGPNLPDRDMMVSPNHRMLLVSEQAQLLFEESEVLVAAKHLVGMDGVQQVDSLGVEYVHFLCDNHEVVLANGAWSESFQPGAYSMGSIDRAQREEIYDLFPELRNREALEDFSAARLTLKRHEASLLVK